MADESALVIQYEDELDPEDSGLDDYEWLARQFESLTTEMEIVTPSQWAEKHRYLPQHLTPLPGPFSFDVAPYLREIVDCFSLDSPIRELAIMKGVQLCMTTGVLENVAGYGIAHVKTAPMMLLTADAELAQQRLDTNVTQLINDSGLAHLIKSSDHSNKRKTGKTNKRIEWVGGGFLLPFGAVNANKLRSTPIQFLLRDEVDAYKLVVGKDGDPMKLSADRTAAYESTRKILDLSTPLVEGKSNIEKRFKLGDQRYYFICCLGCGLSQTLRWRRADDTTGEVSGIVWDVDAEDNLIEDSVRYVCHGCGHEHVNEDKTKLLSPEYGAEWRPTAEPISPEIRSYHINALYSPVGMQSWAACVKKWREAWDDKRKRPKSVNQLQVFYNNVLGEPFRHVGERIVLSTLSPHRRDVYKFGQVPNKFASDHCSSKVMLLTCTVDVHDNNLAVAVWGWCRGGRTILINYERFEGNTEYLDDPGTWMRLQKLVEEQEFRADDGRTYRVMLTLVDAGYKQDVVYRFCSQWGAGVHPIYGRPIAQAFKESVNTYGTYCYAINVDVYKERYWSALRKSWEKENCPIQPQHHFNAPEDVTDDQLKELTVEWKRPTEEGHEWVRPSGAKNELWDLLVYGGASLEILAYHYCAGNLGMKEVDMTGFYDFCEQEKYGFSES